MVKKKFLYWIGCIDWIFIKGYNLKYVCFIYILVIFVKNWLVFEVISIDCDYILFVVFVSYVFIFVIWWYVIRVVCFNFLFLIYLIKK